MTSFLSIRRTSKSKVSTIFRSNPQSQSNPTISDGSLHAFSTPKLRAFHQGRPTGRERRHRGEQVCFPCGSSLPMSRMLHSTANCGFYNSYCQISFLLSHSSSFFTLQEELLIAKLGIFNHRVPLLPIIKLGGNLSNLNVRKFATVIEGDSEFEDDDTEEFSSKPSADPAEVDRVCKVIDELFALDRNMEAVLDECDIKLSHDLVVDVVERFRHARKPAFRFFCWVGQRPGFAHDSRTYNSMMIILGKTRQFETMVSMLEEIGEKGLLTMETFIIAMKAFAAAKERKKALGVFELMKKYKYEVGVDTINCLLNALGREKLGKEAQAIFEKLKDRFTHNLQTYTVLLNGWCRVKNLMEAGRVWNEMIDKGFKPDTVTHNIMLEGLMRSKMRSDAIKLFEVMKAKGPLPNVRSYTLIIRDFCKQTKMKEAVAYFDEMIDSGCQPDAAVYTCLITGFGNLKKMDRVYELLKQMKEKGFPPDGRTYNALIKLMTSRHMPDDAVRICKKMIDCGIEPTIHTYNMIMKSYFRTRNYEMGYAVWDEMNNRGCCPDDNSYTVFIRGLINQGKSREACKLIEEMIDKGMKAPQLDYNKFAADFFRAGEPDILDKLSQKMKFSGKFEVSNVFARWAEMMRKKGQEKRSY